MQNISKPVVLIVISLLLGFLFIFANTIYKNNGKPLPEGYQVGLSEIAKNPYFDIDKFFTSTSYFKEWGSRMLIPGLGYSLLFFSLISFFIQIKRKLSKQHDLRIISIIGIISLILLVISILLDIYAGGHPPLTLFTGPLLVIFIFIGAIMVWFPKKKNGGL